MICPVCELDTLKRTPTVARYECQNLACKATLLAVRMLPRETPPNPLRQSMLDIDAMRQTAFAIHNQITEYSAKPCTPDIALELAKLVVAREDLRRLIETALRCWWAQGCKD